MFPSLRTSSDYIGKGQREATKIKLKIFNYQIDTLTLPVLPAAFFAVSSLLWLSRA